LSFALLTADAAGDHRQIVIADVITNRPGRFPVGKGDAQIAVPSRDLLTNWLSVGSSNCCHHTVSNRD